MFYLGIDIAKNTHVASLMDEKGKTIFKGFSFSNNTTINPITEKKNPQRKPVIGEYPLFLCIIAQTTDITNQIIIDTAFILILLFYIF